MNSHESNDTLPTLNPQSRNNLGNLRKSKNFCLLLQSKSKWGLGQRPAQLNFSPSPCGRGQGGGIFLKNESTNPNDSHESQNSSLRGEAEAIQRNLGESQESKRFFARKYKMLDSHESNEIFRQTPQNDNFILDCHALPIGKSRNDNNDATCHKSLRDFRNNNINSHDSALLDSLDSHDFALLVFIFSASLASFGSALFIALFTPVPETRYMSPILPLSIIALVGFVAFILDYFHPYKHH